MPVEAKPLFRPDVLRAHIANFQPPAINTARLTHWADLIATHRIDGFKEQEILRDFLADFFVGLLGYTRPAGHERYTISWEKHVEVDGKFADAVLGDFNSHQQFVAALEGKGPRDPLDRPFSGRRRSAVEQAYQYAINLRCDWIIVTSIRGRFPYASTARRLARPFQGSGNRTVISPALGSILIAQVLAPKFDLDAPFPKQWASCSNSRSNQKLWNVPGRD